MVEKILAGIEVRLGTDYLAERAVYKGAAKKIIYTGPIDEYFGYRFGELEYRSLRFETETLDTDNYQGVAGMNYTDAIIPYTRIIEHKHFEFGKGNPKKTVITREYSEQWENGKEPYYPVNDEKNIRIYEKYLKESKKDRNVIFAGRLGKYQYYDMDKVIADVLKTAEKEAYLNFGNGEQI